MLEQEGLPENDAIPPASPVVIKNCEGCERPFTGTGFPASEIPELLAADIDGEFCTVECRESQQTLIAEVMSYIITPDGGNQAA